MDIPEWLSQLLRAGFAGLVSALFVSFLSRRQSIQQFWWEKKAEAYIRILAALADVVKYFEAAARTESDEQLNQLDDPSERAHREVARAIEVGDFLISADAHAALRQMEKDLSEFRSSEYRNDWRSYIATEIGSAGKCIKALRVAARVDLQQGLRWRSIWSSQL